MSYGHILDMIEYDARQALPPGQALYFRLSFPGDKIILNIGPGDHTSTQWELTKDQLRCLVLDAMPELLR